MNCVDGCWIIELSGCLAAATIGIAYQSDPFDCGQCPQLDEYDLANTVGTDIGSVSSILA